MASLAGHLAVGRKSVAMNITYTHGKSHDREMQGMRLGCRGRADHNWVEGDNAVSPAGSPITNASGGQRLGRFEKNPHVEPLDTNVFQQQKKGTTSPMAKF